MAYTELIKNFERIRDYMREFYVYGFKSREDYDRKSGRSYDNERRRIESYLGEYMLFHHTPNGKNVFLSIDSRASEHNPLYKALKAKSFTDGDITLHFILFDILYSPEESLTLGEISERIDTKYLSSFKAPMVFDESTIRKKLKEYVEIGLIKCEKQGKQILYHRSSGYDLCSWNDAIAFYSEAGLCGVVGSFLLDKTSNDSNMFVFKHHYITHALESEILFKLFCAIADRRLVTIQNSTSQSSMKKTWVVVPLKIFVSVQSGRRYLMGYNARLNKITSYRLDYITDVKTGEVAQNFDALRGKLACMQRNMWGVSCNKRLSNLEHVEFNIHINDWENHIWKRLEREKRCGTIQRIDRNTAKFSADVFDTWELVPWIRTFICRITEMNFSNRTVENQFRKDIEEMYGMYDISGGDEQ